MDKSAKLLIFISILIIISGFSFLWFGFKPTKLEVSPSPTSIEISENTPEASLSAQRSEEEKVLVTKVVDGDTIDLENGETVRFVGIDTPETVDPRRPVGCFGKEASNETKGLLTNKVVILQKDITDKDKYGRILRYIFLPLENGQTLFVNDYLVREGFARVYTYPPDTKFDVQFREAEKAAKINKRGLWGKC